MVLGMTGYTAALPPFDTDTDPGSLGTCWNKWVQRFENYTTAMNCEFANVEAEIKTQIIQSCASSRLHRKALKEPKLSLDELLVYGRTLELSEMQVTGIERGTTATVNMLDQAADGQKTMFRQPLQELWK